MTFGLHTFYPFPGLRPRAPLKHTPWSLDHLPTLQPSRLSKAFASMASPPLKKVLVPITDGTEPVEASIPADILRRAGADVTVASAGDGLLVEAMFGIKIVADALVADCADVTYDLIVLPGGVPGAEHLRDCTVLEGIVKKHADKGGLYAAICASPPEVLASWGLLNGLRATGHPLFVEKFPPEVTAVESNVVIDGKAVTSRGPGTAMEFALALVEQLYGKDKVDQIAKPMLVKYEAGYTMKEVNSAQWKCNGTPKVLVPIANATEEMEVIMIIDILRRSKADVIVASVEDNIEIVARYGLKLVTDMMLDEGVQMEFDLIIVPGGMPGAKTLSTKEKLVNLLKKQAELNKPYGAICAATAQVLEPHGLLKGKKATTFSSMTSMLTDPSECENRVVVDGNLITSRSPGTAMEYAMAIVEKLFGCEEAQEVAKGLLFVWQEAAMNSLSVVSVGLRI